MRKRLTYRRVSHILTKPTPLTKTERRRLIVLDKMEDTGDFSSHCMRGSDGIWRQGYFHDRRD